MGCDIHMVAQVKRGDEWALLSREELGLPMPTRSGPSNAWDEWRRPRDAYKVFSERWYWRFATLAGVRGFYDGSPLAIAEPRGLPDGLPLAPDDETCLCTPVGELWLGDHSFSWLSLADFDAARGRYTDDQWDTVRELHETLRAYAERLAVPAEDIRLVFGFDS